MTRPRIHVNWLITGAWFDEQVEVDAAAVRLQHLTDWVDHTGLELEYFHKDPAMPYATATANALPEFRSSIGEDCTLALSQDLAATGDQRNDIVLAQNWDLKLTATTTRPMSFFTDRVSDMQDLITIATGKVANIESFSFTHNDVPLRTVGGTPAGQMKEELRYYTQWTSRDDHTERVSPFAMLFTFDDLGGIDGVQRWMQFAAQYRSEVSRVMATRYNDQLFMEDPKVHDGEASESCAFLSVNHG